MSEFQKIAEPGAAIEFDVKIPDGTQSDVIDSLGGEEKIRGAVSTALYGGKPLPIGVQGQEILFTMTDKSGFTLNTRSLEKGGVSKPFAVIKMQGDVPIERLPALMEAMNKPAQQVPMLKSHL